MAKNFLRGVQTKVFFGIMPDALLALPELQAPADVTVTLSAAIVLADDTISVTALSAPIAAGTPLTFVLAGPPIVKLTVYTVAEAAAGATSILIAPADGAIATAAVCAHKGLILLKGGTTSQMQIQNQDQTTKIYQDEDGDRFDDGIVTSAGWEMSYSFNVLGDDASYYRLSYCSANAVNGVRGYLRRELAAPPTYAKGKIMEGLVDVTTNSEDAPADNMVTGQCTFKGRGAPIITPASRV